jgi:hypothetical protein
VFPVRHHNLTGFHICGVWSWSSEVFTYHIIELFQCQQLNVEFPIQVLTHLTLHLIDLSQLKHALPDLFEYVLSQMTFEVIMKAEMNSHWEVSLQMLQ